MHLRTALSSRLKNFSGTYCHRTGTRPPSCQLLQNPLYMAEGLNVWVSPRSGAHCSLTDFKPLLFFVLQVVSFLKFHDGFHNLLQFNLKWSVYTFYWKHLTNLTKSKKNLFDCCLFSLTSQYVIFSVLKSTKSESLQQGAASLTITGKTS